jgi:hypothetical protein
VYESNTNRDIQVANPINTNGEAQKSCLLSFVGKRTLNVFFSAASGSSHDVFHSFDVTHNSSRFTTPFEIVDKLVHVSRCHARDTTQIMHLHQKPL